MKLRLLLNHYCLSLFKLFVFSLKLRQLHSNNFEVILATNLVYHSQFVLKFDLSVFDTTLQNISLFFHLIQKIYVFEYIYALFFNDLLKVLILLIQRLILLLRAVQLFSVIINIFTIFF